MSTQSKPRLIALQQVLPTRMDSIPIMEFCDSTKSIFENPFCHFNKQVPLSKVWDMLHEVLKNEHRLLGDGVLGETNMTGTAM